MYIFTQLKSFESLIYVFAVHNGFLISFTGDTRFIHTLSSKDLE